MMFHFLDALCDKVMYRMLRSQMEQTLDKKAHEHIWLLSPAGTGTIKILSQVK